MPFFFMLQTFILMLAAFDNQVETRSIWTDEFKDYWYTGQAEISSYDLEQVRYGKTRSGYAVLVFVTEDFLKDRQVKLEYGQNEEAVSVLKLNTMRHFLTGVYPYHTMTSVFSPVDQFGQEALKVTTSVQEWCGHVYLQLNARQRRWKGQLNSYFMNEGDRQFSIARVTLEDQIWNWIRLDPDSLPTGQLQIVPGTLFSRFAHTSLQAETARAKTTPSAHTITWYLEYESIQRSLAITFEKDPPHRILSWEEQSSTNGLVTRATKRNTIRLDYWNRNDNTDVFLREQLGLPLE